jgi:RNA polymerase-binding transcription factor DksA
MSTVFEKFAAYQKKLEEEKTRLLKELESHQHVPDFGSDVDSFDEEADEATAFSNELAAAQTIREQLNRVERALNKIHEGTYGACKRCEKTISDDVLSISASARFCKMCNLRS